MENGLKGEIMLLMGVSEIKIAKIRWALFIEKYKKILYIFIIIKFILFYFLMQFFIYLIILADCKIKKFLRIMS